MDIFGGKDNKIIKSENSTQRTKERYTEEDKDFGRINIETIFLNKNQETSTITPVVIKKN